MRQIDVAVLGSTGYAGQELVGILEGHPEVASVQTPMRDELPEFEGSDIVFSALPHGESGKELARLMRLGSTGIDLSGDLRFPTAKEYEQWYKQPHPAPELLPAPYVLPEMDRPSLLGSSQISMPGCYPTATLLALRPLVEANLIDEDSTIVVDAVSGVSGRGKNPSELTHFMNVSGNAVSYNTGRQHRHVGEIELFLEGNKIFFSPTVIPIERGMLVKATAKLASGATSKAVRDTYERTYSAEPFVEVLTDDQLPDIRETSGSDECHIGFVVVDGMVQTGSSIDNLRKGASSQAVQAFNMICALPEETGLTPKAGWSAADRV